MNIEKIPRKNLSELIADNIRQDIINGKILDWGCLQTLIDSTTIGSKTGFSMGLITYKKPHYSGYHDDNEAIYILQGKGAAMIGSEKIKFNKGSVLVIPASTEHCILEIFKGPVRAVLIHFQ